MVSPDARARCPIWFHNPLTFVTCGRIGTLVILFSCSTTGLIPSTAAAAPPTSSTSSSAVTTSNLARIPSATSLTESTTRCSLGPFNLELFFLLFRW